MPMPILSLLLLLVAITTTTTSASSASSSSSLLQTISGSPSSVASQCACQQREPHHLLRRATTSHQESSSAATTKFYVFRWKANWHQAVAMCADYGLRLAQVDSSAKNRVIGAMLQRNDQLRGEQFWLGATDQHDEGEWLWMGTGERVQWENFHSGQPDNWAQQHCLVMWPHQQWTWDDQHCVNEYYFICEKWC